MTIDFVLVSLQTLFLCLYGAQDITSLVSDRKVYWLVVATVFFCSTLACIYFGSFIKNNAQLIIFLLLLPNYLLHLGGADFGKLLKTVILAGITFMAYASLYLRLELPEGWLIIPFVFVALIGMTNKWLGFLVKLQEYFLKAGTLLTLLFMVEPIVLGSVQQNLKPVATIPLTEIINQQNFLLLGALIALMLAGFFWKEKSRF
ncbi:MAG: hypothetical protein AAGF96_23010 [Bacteroidota bacterium]